MKRTVRWIGIGVTLAAAATMLLADVALAGAAGAAGQGPAAAAVLSTPDQTTRDTVGPGSDRAAMMTIVDAGQRTEYQHKTFVHPG